jgi:ketosteroid isomerase-like protein
LYALQAGHRRIRSRRPFVTGVSCTTRYERAPTTTMVGATVLRGWDAIAARYHDKYGDAARMGALTFSELEVRPLGPDWALALGHWALARTAAAGGPVGGWFTLTLHKGRDGWRIVVDHTS